MKNILVLLFSSFLTLYGQKTASIEENYVDFIEDCDACGCSTTGGAFGFGDLSQKNSLTLRYLYQSYQTKENIFNNSPWNQETFQTLQILGLFSISKKFKILSIIPYSHLNRNNASIQGIGDVTINGVYELINSSTEKKGDHLVYIGGGFKIPTGTFNNELRGNINPGFQLGTGSLDYSILSEYQWKYNQLTWQTLVNYLWKTTNQNDFKFGNQLNLLTGFTYHLNYKSVNFFPTIGYALEVSEKNVDFGVTIPNSNGTLHMLKVGNEFKINQWGLGIHYFTPFKQNLMNQTVQLNNRWNVQLQYNF
jgi:hypothetical protein